ncbi:MAG: PIN domain-containing protein [Candidatus Nanoarchaeia archaeon]|nr:PIN domain-containing protein [Candidatus Nanoarchaeia archaeon]
MQKKYYIDSCIWIDYFENRSDRFKPLGDWAFLLFKKIINENNLILYSDLLQGELSNLFNESDITEILSIIPERILLKVNSSKIQLKETMFISKKFMIPVNDALHFILARENNAILITRDKHLLELPVKIKVAKPEELI